MKKLLSVGCLFLLLFSCRTQETEKTKNDVVVKSDKADIISYVIKDRKGGNILPFMEFDLRKFELGQHSRKYLRLAALCVGKQRKLGSDGYAHIQPLPVRSAVIAERQCINIRQQF